MSRHATPGPWEVYAQFNIRSVAVERGVANCGGPRDGSVEDSGFAENCANARLIATAPDLLQIAKRWAALDSGAWHVERHASEKKKLLRDTIAAIAKTER